MIPLARKTLVYEWRRFVSPVLAVGFSGVLLLVQAALVLGIFGSAAVSVTASSADLWAGYPGTQSVNFGRAIQADVETRLRLDPEVTAVEPYLWVEGDWQQGRPGHGGVSVYVSGVRTAADALLFSRALSPGLRARLREPGAVIVDSSDLDQLGVAIGGRAWINGQAVRLVGTVDGIRALGGVNVLASLDTARRLAGPERGGAEPPPTYLVAKLRDPARAEAVRARLQPPRSFGPVALWTASEFAERSQRYWLLDTGAGAAVLFMAVIVCLVGAVITSQTLTAVVAASAREYAVLNALGASLFSLSRVVLEQAGWIGLCGLLVSAVAGSAVLAIAARQAVPVAMNPSTAAVCAGLVLAVALVSGLLSVRGLQRAEPALLLR
jgi:putative ABC transport system permease protein